MSLDKIVAACDIPDDAKAAIHTREDLIRYIWETHVSKRSAIPEFFTMDDLLEVMSLATSRKLSQGEFYLLLSSSIADYGVLDDAKAEILLQTKDEGRRKSLAAAYFRSKNGKANAKSYVQYIWENRLKSESVPIPELVSKSAIPLFPISVYNALSVEPYNLHHLFAASLTGYGRMSNEKAEAFLNMNTRSFRIVLSKSFFSDERAKANMLYLVNYTWRTRLKSRRLPLPELVGTHDIRDLLGSIPYHVLDVAENDISEVLSHCLPSYGIMDERKAKIYLSTADSGTRVILSGVFFSGEKAQANAKKIVRYAWKTIRSADFPIPELLGFHDMHHLVGMGPYRALDITPGKIHDLLSACIPRYGVMSDKKAEEFMKAQRNKRNTMAHAFFSGELAQENVKALLLYLWENKIQSEAMPIPELIDAIEISHNIGESAYRAMGLKPGNVHAFLSPLIQGYGQLDGMKAASLAHAYDRLSSGKRHLAEARLMRDNPKNAELFLEAYQQENELRLRDLLDAEYAHLPCSVKSLIRARLRQNIDSADNTSCQDYHCIHIRWNDDLEEKLREAVRIHKLADPDWLWQNLGTTPFAARMKAEKLEILPPQNHFGDGKKSSIATYPLIEFSGYAFSTYALTAAQQLEGALSPEVSYADVHLFETPVHKQHFHANLPVKYKGITLSDYSSREQDVIIAVAAYLQDPNVFEKIRLIKDTPDIIFEYKAPSSISAQPRIAPIRLPANPFLVTQFASGGGENFFLSQVFLPRRLSKDPAGIHSAVLDINGFKIYAFKHCEHGYIAK